MKKLMLSLCLIPSCIYSCTEQDILEFVEYEMFMYQDAVSRVLESQCERTIVFHYYVGRLEAYSQVRDFIKYDIRD